MSSAPSVAASPRSAVLLFAHGSRDPVWRQPMEAVARQIAASAPDIAVCCAYLELCAPTLPDAVEALVGNGVVEISIVPMFLGVGKHAREDLPLLVEQLRLQYPTVCFILQRPVGEDSRLLATLASIALTPQST